MLSVAFSLGVLPDVGPIYTDAQMENYDPEYLLALATLSMAKVDLLKNLIFIIKDINFSAVQKNDFKFEISTL